MNIRYVRFTQPVHIGTQFDLNSGLESGQRLVGEDQVFLDRYDDLFLRVTFVKQPSQLIPWNLVSGVFLAEEKERVPNKSRS